MSILTNRIKIDFHIDAIKRDFVFIRLERQQNGNWWGAEELDRLIGDDYKAGSSLLLMLNTSVNKLQTPVGQ
ncbi:hypothetical protein [Nostoc sp.]|uniref:hypothetical protein n=1 Tax=Nostoc sp. TaxID=1180 RepID=UPI002FF1AFAD